MGVAVRVRVHTLRPPARPAMTTIASPSFPHARKPRHRTRRRGTAWITAVVLGGCVTEDADRRPAIALGADVASMFVHRGMPQNEHGVLQGTMDATLPLRTEGDLVFSTFANMDLSDDVGDAWFDDGHGGRISQFDVIATYTHTFDAIELAAGVHNYNFPFGESFPSGPRGATTELFLHAAAEVLGARPEVQIRHDVDQAQGTYVRLGISEPFELGERWTLILNGHVGWSSESQSWWNYGVRAQGFADLQGGATVAYAWDDRTTLGATLQGSTILDSDIADWFDLLGIDTSNVWVGAFVRWRY